MISTMCKSAYSLCGSKGQVINSALNVCSAGGGSVRPVFMVLYVTTARSVSIKTSQFILLRSYKTLFNIKDLNVSHENGTFDFHVAAGVVISCRCSYQCDCSVAQAFMTFYMSHSVSENHKHTSSLSCVATVTYLFFPPDFF